MKRVMIGLVLVMVFFSLAFVSAEVVRSSARTNFIVSDVSSGNVVGAYSNEALGGCSSGSWIYGLVALIIVVLIVSWFLGRGRKKKRRGKKRK